MKLEKLEKRINNYGYEQIKCPVCGGWHYTHNIRFHIAKKSYYDEKHKKFYLKNTKEVLIRRWKE